MIKHSAYNLITGEVIECNSGNALKKHVATITRFNKRYYNSPNKWVFAHGKNAIEKVCKKAQKNPLMSR